MQIYQRERKEPAVLDPGPTFQEDHLLCVRLISNGHSGAIRVFQQLSRYEVIDGAGARSDGIAPEGHLVEEEKGLTL